MALTDNLISYWKLDEASGNALDAHSTNELTDTNSVAAGTGIINGARDFEADSNHEFDIASNASLQIADIDVSYTFTCWINLESTGTRIVFRKRDSTNVGGSLEYMLRIATGTPTMFWGDSGAGFGSLSVGSAVSTGVWAFIVCGYDASTDKFFISLDNGTMQESAAVTNQTLAGANAFGLGATTDNAEDFDGLIDEVGFWKRRLTADEITSLYNSGAGLSYDNFAGGSAGAALLILNPNIRGGLSGLRTGIN